MLELTLRLVFSLAVVVGLLLLLARFGARRFAGGAGSLVHVVHRQPLSRTSAVAVVTVGSRVLVLGTTEQQVSVLAELDPEELVTEEQVAEALAAPATAAPISATSSDPAAAHEADAPTVSVVQPVPRTSLGTPKHLAGQPGTGGLNGSVLSPQTWKQALAALSTARKAS
ncbi:flagellar biosynthetic protein FliO [Nocardioides daphniae]|uniref:Flagellar protein n=1 Tax=Nocardioides daphniae TaxID=402297 RepID=A0A4P7UF53_9ACTN|nr:flagellar biosynthetic protein FliO [Nocardioides daphniae]QCC78171.1 hypothetical protein E2C04_15020 [Nocardioides daphniae]GGD21308.1 hypothetical protein GCM10007231_20570 [Nocardioides daphniae]